MSKYLSAKELIGVPGLPTSRQAIVCMAKRQGWGWIHNYGKGGGKLFAVADLPAIAQTYLAGFAIHTPAIELTTSSIGGCALAQGQGGSAAPLLRENVGKAGRFESKAILLDRFDKLRHELGLKLTAARKLFVRLFNEGKILADYDIRRAIGRISTRGLQRWESIARRSAAALGGRYGKNRGINQIDKNPALLEACLANLHLSAAEIRRQLRVLCPLEKLPSRTTVWRWLNNFKRTRPADFALVVDPQRYLDRFQPRVGSLSENVTAKNEMWMIDATILDLFARNGQRYVLIQLIDVFSRRKVAHLCETSSSAEVAILIRKAVLKFGGIPKYLKLDNGMEFKSEHISVSAKELGIEQYFCQAFSPWEKGQIERSFGTLNNYLATLSGYCGHNTVERKKIVKREGKIEGQLTWAELSTLIDQYWIEEETTHIHDALGMTPLAKWNSCMAALRTVDIRQLDFALTPWYRRNPKVIKGSVTINKHKYSSLHGHQLEQEGRQVRVKLNPYIVGVIHIFDVVTDEYLFDLTCPELLGESRIDHVRAIKAAERDRRKPFRNAVNRLRRKAQEQRDRVAKEAVDSVILKPDSNLIPLVMKEKVAIDIYEDVATQPIVTVVPKAKRNLMPSSREMGDRARGIVESLFKGLDIRTVDRQWLESVYMPANPSTFDAIVSAVRVSLDLGESVPLPA